MQWILCSERMQMMNASITRGLMPQSLTILTEGAMHGVRQSSSQTSHLLNCELH